MQPAEFAESVRASAAGGTPGRQGGLWLTFLGPFGLEVAAEGAVDWVGIDLQHGEIEPSDVPGLLRVCERAEIPAVARLGSHDPAAVARILDTGVQGVIIPAVDDAGQAAALASAAYVPPAGRRSVGLARSSLSVVSATADPLLLAMVETVEGFDAVAEILAVDGIDGVFVGPYDLALAMGEPSPTAPNVVAAVRAVADAARAQRKVIGVFAGLPELVELRDEVDLIAVAADAGLVRAGLQQLFGSAGG